MDFQYPFFIQELEDKDPNLFQLIKKNIDLAMSPGVLDNKTRFLIMLALDAFKGSGSGVRALAKQAYQSGASKQEIQETLRIVYLISSMECLKAGAEAYNIEGID